MAASSRLAEKNIDSNLNLSDVMQTSHEIDEFKNRYYAQLTKDYEFQQKPVIKPWTQQKILEVIEHVKNAKVTIKDDGTSPKTYWHLRYDVIKIAEEDILIMKKNSPNCATIRVLPFEEYFGVIFKVHSDCGHGASGIDKIEDVLKKNFIISRRAIELFVILCPICQHKSNTPKIGIEVYNTRGEVDLIDMQSVPDGPFKWILNYQDLNSKFVHLRPLCSKEASEIGSELLKIFLEFGVPCTLQSSIGIEFTDKIIKEIVQLWSECKVIKGVPHHPQIEDNDECSNEDVENMIWAWMRDNTSAEWITGSLFVQYSKNTSFDKVLGRSPFQALFQSESKRQPSTLQETNESMVETESPQLPRTTYSSPNVLQSLPYQKAKKRKITSQDSETPNVKKQKITSLESKSEYDLLRLETESSELSRTTSSLENTPSFPQYQNANYNPPTSLNVDMPKAVSDSHESAQTMTSRVHIITSTPYNTETPNSGPRNPELSRPLTPIYMPSSPPYQSQTSNSPVYMQSSPSYYRSTKKSSQKSNNTDSDTPRSETINPKLFRSTSPVYLPLSPQYQSRTLNSPEYASLSPSSYQNTNNNPPTTQNNDTITETQSRELSRQFSSPGYMPCPPTYKPLSPLHTNSSSPIYKPSSPIYKLSSPAYKPCSPTYAPPSPVYKSSSPTYDEPSSPIYKSSSPANKPTSPTYAPSSPVYKSSSPTYDEPSSPIYKSSSPANKPTSPTYEPSPPLYQNGLPAPQDNGTEIVMTRNLNSQNATTDIGG